MTLHSTATGGAFVGRWARNASDRAYAALGWRSILLFVGAAWSLGLPMVIVGPLVFRDFGRLSAETTMVLTTRFALTWLGCVCAVLAATTYCCRPVHRYERDPALATAVEAWVALQELPRRFARWTFPTAIIPGIAGGLWSVSTAVRMDAQLVVIGSLATAAGTGAMITVAVVGMPTVTRPILRALAPGVPNERDRAPAISLRRLVRVVVPLIGVMTAVAGAAFSLQPGGDRGEAIFHLGVAVGIATLVSVPASLILGHALLQPLDDLLQAAERLKYGDYATAIPPQPTREFETLARSFNEAMAGTRERLELEQANSRLLEDVRESRLRIVQTSDAAQRRIERNIHDGAQQRLIATTLKLRLLRDSLAGTAEERLVQEVESSVDEALLELRTLARGFHPPVLTSDGLRPALRQLAAHSPIPTYVTAGDERYPEPVEAMAYFVAAEGLANATRHSQGSRIDIGVSTGRGALQITVRDNGVGGAALEAGSGLTGLVDRVAALNGHLEVSSPSGRGTRVTAWIPVG